MVAGPEVSRLLANYEAVSGAKDVKKSNRHHEQTEAAQKSFFEKVKRLTSVMREMGNHFTEESDDLLVLDMKDIADSSVAKLIAGHHKRGKEQFKSFMKDLQSGDGHQCSFYKPIKKNITNVFKHNPVVSGTNSKMKELKDDYRLFSRLFISCPNRQCDLQEFFKHENQPSPASLCDRGKLRTCTKSQLSDIIQAKVTLPENKPESDVLIVDGSALANTLLPHSPKTFDEYARMAILPRIETYSNTYRRTDIVFDVYWQSSLKQSINVEKQPGGE